jgi:hypothetical protein
VTAFGAWRHEAIIRVWDCNNQGMVTKTSAMGHGKAAAIGHGKAAFQVGTANAQIVQVPASPIL